MSNVHRSASIAGLAAAAALAGCTFPQGSVSAQRGVNEPPPVTPPANPALPIRPAVPLTKQEVKPHEPVLLQKPIPELPPDAVLILRSLEPALATGEKALQAVTTSRRERQPLTTEERAEAKHALEGVLSVLEDKRSIALMVAQMNRAGVLFNAIESVHYDGPSHLRSVLRLLDEADRRQGGSRDSIRGTREADSRLEEFHLSGALHVVSQLRAQLIDADYGPDRIEGIESHPTARVVAALRDAIRSQAIRARLLWCNGAPETRDNGDQVYRDLALHTRYVGWQSTAGEFASRAQAERAFLASYDDVDRTLVGLRALRGLLQSGEVNAAVIPEVVQSYFGAGSARAHVALLGLRELTGPGSMDRLISLAERRDRELPGAKGLVLLCEAILVDRRPFRAVLDIGPAFPAQVIGMSR